MAAKAFLTQNQIDELKKQAVIHTSLIEESARLASHISQQIEKFLIERLSSHKSWARCRPVIIGSWSRGQLCPKSDIDILFLGDEAVVREFVNDALKAGIKLRYRVPADRKDWSVGVESFDRVALVNARALDPSDHELSQFVYEQQQKILSLPAKELKKIIREMVKERKERESRYDSLSNYLEPNLKYGPGTLRDIDQALSIAQLVLRETNDSHLAQVLNELKKSRDYFLFLRQKIQILGGLDTLTSALQKELAEEFKFNSIKDFMRDVQLHLSQVSFFADYVVERALSSPARLRTVSQCEVSDLESAFAFLQKDSSLLAQEKVFRFLQELESRQNLAFRKKFNLAHYFNIHISDKVLIAYFRSGLIPFLLRDLKRVQGLVQHDQYHRLTVEAHTLQAVREVLRVKKNPRQLGPLKKIASEMGSRDWTLLLWTALFHDLGKGLDGDHATLGGEIAKKEMVRFGVSLRTTLEVIWMVQKHLLMSGAAFRQNPQSTSTWQWLFSQGLKGQRITWLTLFTAIDIRATNREAWNDWKERLLFELAQALHSPRASRVNQLVEKVQKEKLPLKKEFFENLDPSIVESISPRFLFLDYKSLLKKKRLEIEVLKGPRSKLYWVRFHSLKDKKGLFLDYVQALYSAGASISEAYIQTYSDWGVYDWFLVQSGRDQKALKKLIVGSLDRVTRSEVNEVSSFSESESSLQKYLFNQIKFESIDCVREDGDFAILSFRGVDQKGALLAATQALYEAGLSIRWARVHTWGRQIDDVFGVEKSKLSTAIVSSSWLEILKKLRVSLAVAG